MFSDATESEMHLFKWVSGNQRPALGTALSWDRRLLGKAGLASVLLAVLREAEISARKDLGCALPPQKPGKACPLCLLGSSECHQHSFAVHALTSSASDPSSGTTGEFCTNSWEPCQQLLSEVHHTSNIIQSLIPKQLDWSLFHCSSNRGT